MIKTRNCYATGLFSPIQLIKQRNPDCITTIESQTKFKYCCILGNEDSGATQPFYMLMQKAKDNFRSLELRFSSILLKHAIPATHRMRERNELLSWWREERISSPAVERSICMVFAFDVGINTCPWTKFRL